MNADKLIQLLKEPSTVKDVDAEEIHQLAQKYPYSQPIQLLYTVSLRDSNAHLFNQQLGKTSILTQDRSLLFELFEGHPIQEDNGLPLEAIEVKSPKVKLPKVEDKKSPLPAVVPVKIVPTVKEEPEEIVEAPLAIETPKPSTIEKVEQNLKDLPASERIKAILEKSRKMRKDFEAAKSGSVPPPQKEEPVKSIVPDEEVITGTPTDEGEDILQVDNEQIETRPETTPEINEVPSEPAPEQIFTIDLEEEQQVATPLVEDGDEDLAPILEEPKVEEPPTPVVPEPEPEVRSFKAWLRDPNVFEEEEPTTPQNLENKIELFDTFAEKLPKLKKKSREGTGPTERNLDLKNLPKAEEGSLVTETLANIYIQQKHYTKAIKAYEILKLKYPEKSSFFADQILEIKKLINSK